jgi:hypothetical protein
MQCNAMRAATWAGYLSEAQGIPTYLMKSRPDLCPFLTKIPIQISRSLKTKNAKGGLVSVTESIKSPKSRGKRVNTTKLNHDMLTYYQKQVSPDLPPYFLGHKRPFTKTCGVKALKPDSMDRDYLQI